MRGKDVLKRCERCVGPRRLGGRIQLVKDHRSAGGDGLEVSAPRLPLTSFKRRGCARSGAGTGAGAGGPRRSRLRWRRDCGHSQQQVRALVFVAALAPDEGETVADVFYRIRPHPQAPKLAPDSHGLIYLSNEAFAAAFAQNATVEELAVLAAVQRPISPACITFRVPRPLWKNRATWFLVAEQDRRSSRKISASWPIACRPRCAPTLSITPRL